MEQTPVRVGLMDSRRPGVVALLPARHLGFGERSWRALKRLVSVSVVSLLVLNVMLLVIPIPWVHLCTVPLAIVLGPVVAALTLNVRVLLGACALPCPRCAEQVNVPNELPGWPARFNCLHCGVMVQLDAARARPY